MKNKPGQTMARITEENFECALNKVHKCKSAGIVTFPNFWFFYLNTAHQKLTQELQEMVNDFNIHSLVSKGITFLLPQNDDTHASKILQNNYMSSHNLQTPGIYSDKTYIFPIKYYLLNEKGKDVALTDIQINYILIVYSWKTVSIPTKTQ